MASFGVTVVLQREANEATIILLKARWQFDFITLMGLPQDSDWNKIRGGRRTGNTRFVTISDV